MSTTKLFAACVLIWGTTWLAITFQFGSVAPEASVCNRFLLASLVVFAYCRTRGLSLRFSARQHRWIAAQGIILYSVAYILVYQAEMHIVSGLVAVAYSAMPLLNMLGVRVFFGTPMRLRVAAGGALGIAGITLVFLPEFSRLSHGDGIAIGVIVTVCAVIASAAGNVIASRSRELELPVWPSMAWGMLYGAAFTFVATFALGKTPGFDFSAAYIGSLLYLSLLGSVLAFGAFLTILNRIGAARAGYIGVMAPIVALVVSAVFEGFSWHVETWIGIALSLAGNVIILRKQD